MQSVKKIRQKLLGFIPAKLCKAGAVNESKMGDDDEEDAFTPVIFFADKPSVISRSSSSPCCCLIDPFASIKEEEDEGDRPVPQQPQSLVPVRLFPNMDASFESIRFHTIEEVCEDCEDDESEGELSKSSIWAEVSEIREGKRLGDEASSTALTDVL